MTKKTIEIFKAGTHVAEDGRRYTFSEAEVAAIAAAYDPAKFSAPAVIGHPKTDDPAHGWVEAVRVRDDGVMVADLGKISPAFSELVQSGAYRKISSSFYPANHPNNPTPGQLHLRHVGFLGAASPGVQGLAPVAFAEGDDEGLINFALGDEFRPLVWLARSLGRVLRRQREQIVATDGVEAADKLVPEYDIEAAMDAAARLDLSIERPGVRFAEGESLHDIAAAARTAELDQREAAIAAREQAAADQAAQDAAAQATAAAEARRAEDQAFAEGLVAAGKLPPGHTAAVVGFCESLAGNDAIAFAEGGEAQDPRAAFKAFLAENLGVSIHFGEVAGAEGLEFAEGRTVDDLAAAIESEMTAAEAAGKPIGAAEASRRAKSRR